MALVGIDLGTTNSVIATMEHGRVEVLPNREGKLTTPSVVFFEGDGLDKVLVGEPAVFSLMANPDRAVRFIKRHMGTDYKAHIDGSEYTPEQLSSVILKKMVDDAQESFFGPSGEKITDAVVTVPAYFGPQERDATKRAAELIGLNLLALLPEPIAAAIDFAQTEGEKLADKTILVYDLGGGTFDVTAMQVKRQGGENGPLAFRILGKDGSVQLGGADWDEILADHVAAEFAAAKGKNPQDSPKSYETLLQYCQGAKETLSRKKPDETVEILCTHDGENHTVRVSREKFEDLTRHLMNETIDKSSQLVEKLFGKEEPWKQIDMILLVGGSTKMPCVPEMLEKLSGIKPQTSRGVDLNVGRGAAFLAFSPDAWTLEEGEFERRPELRGPVEEHGPKANRIVTIRDVVTHSIGLTVVDAATRKDVNYIFIKQGMPTGEKVVESFGLEADGQTGVEIVINRGESDDPTQVEKLASVLMSGLPSTSRRGEEVRIALSVDGNGLIVGEGLHVPSGTRADIRVELELIKQS